MKNIYHIIIGILLVWLNNGFIKAFSSDFQMDQSDIDYFNSLGNNEWYYQYLIYGGYLLIFMTFFLSLKKITGLILIARKKTELGEWKKPLFKILAIIIFQIIVIYGIWLMFFLTGPQTCYPSSC